MALKLFGNAQTSAWTGIKPNTPAEDKEVTAPAPVEDEAAGKVHYVHTPNEQMQMGKTDIDLSIDQGAEAAMLMGVAEDTNRFYRDVPRDKCKTYIDGLGDTSEFDDATLKGHAKAMMDMILGGVSDFAFGKDTAKMNGRQLFDKMSEYANGTADALKSKQLADFDAMDPAAQLEATKQANKGLLGVVWTQDSRKGQLEEEFRKILSEDENATLNEVFGPDLAKRESPEFKEKTKDLQDRYKAAVIDVADREEIADYRKKLEEESILYALSSKNFRWLSDNAKKFITAQMGNDDFDYERFLSMVPEAEQETTLAALHMARGEKKALHFFGLVPGGGIDGGMEKYDPKKHGTEQHDAMRIIYGAATLLPRLIGDIGNFASTGSRYLWAKAFYDEAEFNRTKDRLELEYEVKNAMTRPLKDADTLPGRLIAAYGDNFGFQFIGGLGRGATVAAERQVQLAKLGKAKGMFGWLGNRLSNARGALKTAEAMEGASDAVRAEVAALKANEAALKAYRGADKLVEAAKESLEMAKAGKGKVSVDAASKALDSALTMRGAKAEALIQAHRAIHGGIPATKEAIEGAKFYDKILSARKAAAVAVKNIDRAGSAIKGAAYAGENALWFVPFYEQQVQRDVADGIPIETSLKTRWLTMLACGWAEKAVFTRMAQGRMSPQMLTATSNKAIKESAVRFGVDAWNKIVGDAAPTLMANMKTLNRVIYNRIYTDAAHGIETGINVTAQSILDEFLDEVGKHYEKNADKYKLDMTWDDLKNTLNREELENWVRVCLDVVDNSKVSAPGFAVLSPFGMRMGHRIRQNRERSFQRKVGNTTGTPWENANINTDDGLLAARSKLDAAEMTARKYLEQQAAKRSEMRRDADPDAPIDQGRKKAEERKISDDLRGIMQKVLEIGAGTHGTRDISTIMSECKVDRPTAEILLSVANDYALLESPLQSARMMYEEFINQVGVRSAELIGREILRGTIPGARNLRYTDEGIAFDIDVDGKPVTFGYRTMDHITDEDLKEASAENSAIGQEYDTAPEYYKLRDASGKTIAWKNLSEGQRKDIVYNRLQGFSTPGSKQTGKSAGRIYMTEADGTKRYIDVDEIIHIFGSAQAGVPRHETAHSIIRAAERLGYFTQADKKVCAEYLGIDTESDAANEIIDGGVPRWVANVDEALAEGYRQHTMGLSTPAWSRLADNYEGANAMWKKVLGAVDKFVNNFGKSVSTRPDWAKRSAYNVAALDKFYDAMFRSDITDLGKIVRELKGEESAQASTGNTELDAYNKAVEDYKFQRALAGSGNKTADVEGAKKRMNDAMNALREANRKRRSSGEVEARNAEERIYSLSKQAELMIADTEDVPRSEQIVRSTRYSTGSVDSLPAEVLSSADKADVDSTKIVTNRGGEATRYCLVSGLEGAGLTYEKNKKGVLSIILPNGKRVSESNPATADDLISTDSMLMHLIDLGIKNGTIGRNATEGQAFKRNIAQAFAECFNLAAKWGNTTGGIDLVDTMWRWIADDTFKAIKKNSDDQYGTYVDILTICKKTDMLMQVVSDYMKKEQRGAMPTDIMNLYLKTGEARFQTPCPVCYVFSRWIRAGYDRQTAWEAQNLYAHTYTDKDGKFAWRKGYDPSTKEGKAYWTKEYQKWYTPSAQEAKKKGFERTPEQVARENEIKKAKEVLTLGYQAFDKAMRNGDRAEADRVNNEIADAFEKIRTADIAGWIKYSVFDVAEDTAWTDFRPVPSDILFDFRAAVDIYNQYPALDRFYGSKGSAGGKAIETEARNDLGDVIAGIAKDGNPFVNQLKNAYAAAPGSAERKAALKEFDNNFKSALAKSIRQRLIGGQRFFSWSDNRVEFGFDMMMNLMQIQLLGDSIQSYSKQLEGAELLSKHGAYNNGSLMGAGNGLEDAVEGESGSVLIGGRWKKLKFSDIQGINHEALFRLNKMYDKSGNILVGMNDDHIRVALRDERIFFIIPWHSSGLGTGLLDYMLTSLGEDAHGTETDYSSVQSEKWLSGSTPDDSIVGIWDKAEKKSAKMKIGGLKVSHKKGAITDEQIVYRTLRNAILSGNADQSMINNAWKDPFLRQIIDDLASSADEIGGMKADGTYVKKHLKNPDTGAAMPMLKMTAAAIDHIYPYEYWDRKSTYGKASVNSARYLEYCRRLGVLPKFCGIVIEKGGAKPNGMTFDKDANVWNGTKYGDFTDEENYWKLLIDRRMYANGKNGFADGKYQHTDQVQMVTAKRGFDIDTINPETLKAKWGKYITKPADPKAVGKIVDEVRAEQKKQGYRLVGAGMRGSLGIPPGLSNAIDTDTLMSMAAAGRLAKSLSGRDSVRQDIERRVRAIYDGATENEINNRIISIMSKAEQEALDVNKDFKADNRDSEVIKRMTSRQVEKYMRSLEGAGKQGLAVGARAEGARQELDRRIERKIADSVAAQTGISVNELESGLGVDLAETMVRIHDLENQAFAKRKEENPEADDVETPPELAIPLTEEERNEAEQIIRSLVDGVVGKAWEETDEAKAKREERKRKAEARGDSDEELADEGLDGVSNEEQLAKFILEKYPVDLRNPEHFARFIALLAERKWKIDHGIPTEDTIWGDPVALQHIRMTAVNVYDSLARKLMYSSKRETAMEAINRIGDAANFDAAVNEMTFAGKVIAQGMVREKASDLVKDLEQLLEQGFGAKGRFKHNEEDIHRKVSGWTELWARDVKKVLRWSPDKVANEIDKLRKRMMGNEAEFLLNERDPNTSKQFNKDMRMVAALQEYGGMLYKSLGEITDARVNILDRLDADKVAEEAVARDERTKQMSAVLGKAFDTGKTQAYDETSLRAKVSNYFQEHLDFKHLLEDLMRYCKDTAVRDAAKEFIDNLQHDIQRRWDKARTEERVQLIQFKEAVKAIYGKSYESVMSYLLAHDKRFDKFGQGEVNEDTGVATMVKMSRAAAMQLYVSMQQRGYIGNVKANKREAQSLEIRNLLTKEDLTIIKWMGDWYDKERAGISSVSERLFGLPVEAEEANYFPVKVLVPTQGLEKGGAVVWNPFPPALTPRVKHGYDFDCRENIVSMWTHRMTEQAQWKQMAELGIELRGIFGRQSLQSTIRRCHGNAALKNVMSFITDILNGSSGIKADSMAEKSTLDKMRGTAAICALGGNLGVMLKQTTSIPAYALEIGVGQTMKHLSTAFTPDGLRAMYAILHSDQFYNRWDMGNSEEVANAIRECLSTKNAFQTKVSDPLKRLFKASMVTNKMGDIVPTLIIGQGIYRSFVRQGMQAEEAMNRMWEIANRTQQTNQMDNKSMMQRRSKYGNLITQFQSCVRQYLAYEVAAARKFGAADKWLHILPKDMEVNAEFARATFLTCGVLPSLYYLGGVLWQFILGKDPDDAFLDDWVKSVLISNSASLYGWGLLADGIASEMFFGKRGKEPTIPAMQIANSFVRTLSTMGYDIWNLAPLIWDGNSDVTIDDLADDALKGLKGLNAPLRDAMKALENYGN